MKDRRIKNIAASVRQRLFNFANASGRPFQEVLQYYAMERFLYRLSRTTHADRFVLKGALMLAVWRVPSTRSTRDIDLLGLMENSVEAVENAIRDACRQAVDPDGLVFDPASVAGAAITEEAAYEGVRVTFRGFLEKARLSMQVDVGFGDVVYPSPTAIEYPTILGQSPPQLHGYCRETAVAEKFEAMVKLGLLNSRMKDFYDIWLLSRQFDFDGPILARAIRETFSRRQTRISAEPTALTTSFATDPSKNAQWQAFLRKSRLQDAAVSFAQVGEQIARLLVPPATATSRGEGFSAFWHAPGPWVAT